MPSNPKLLLPNSVILVTTRTEDGLPFPPQEHIKTILEGILATATSRYDLDLCHYVWMSNHFHMLMVVRNPEEVPACLRYIKTESAYAINKILGRKKKTIWEEGYDSPTILSKQDVVKYLSLIHI